MNADLSATFALARSGAGRAWACGAREVSAVVAVLVATGRVAGGVASCERFGVASPSGFSAGLLTISRTGVPAALRMGLAVRVGGAEVTGFVAGFGVLTRVGGAGDFLTAALVTVFLMAGLGRALPLDFTGVFFAGALARIFVACLSAVLRAGLAGFFFAVVLAMVFIAFFGVGFRVEVTVAFFSALAGALRSVFFALTPREGFAETFVLRLPGAVVFLLAMIRSSGCVRPGQPRWGKRRHEVRVAAHR